MGVLQIALAEGTLSESQLRVEELLKPAMSECLGAPLNDLEIEVNWFLSRMYPLL